jgi:hypothetical protein
VARYERDLAEAVLRLREAGVEPLLVKGLAAARNYADPASRPHGDLDLLVRPEEEEPARAALAGARISVDLHTEAGSPANVPIERCTTDELLARSEVVEVEGVEVRVARAEDHLRLLALHFLAHGGWRPLWLCDVAAALEARPTEFDWDLCLRRPRRAGSAVACTIALAGELLGAELGDAPRVTPPRWLRHAVVRQWGVPASTFPRLVQGRPLRTYVRRPQGAGAALRARWPNPIESSVYLRAPFNSLPRLPYQLAYLAVRVGYRRWRRPLHS